MAGIPEAETDIPATMSKLARSVLDDTFYNIIHDLVSKVHREEKIARMRSAVVLAKKIGEEETNRLQKQEGALENGSAELSAATPSNVKQKDSNLVRVETDGAIYENGKVYLKGNPFQTTKEILCPNCRFPRLLYPPSGIGSRPPPDPYKEYCKKHPPIIMPGHDVHGNPFATDKINRKKKQQPQQPNSSNTPASSPPSTPSTPSNSFKHVVAEKISFPTVKCPNCPRYFVVTRVAQHLDRCLGLSGRLTKRNLTPMESGTSTPVPLPTKPSMLKRALPNGDDDTASGSIPKKKKLNTPKKYASKKPTPPSKLKIGTTPDMAAAMEFPDSTPTSAGGGGDVEPASATTTTTVTTSKKKLNPTEGKPGKLKRNDIQRQVKA
ncbi:conserved hypothetical protein [Histoplasma capsulatum var. duboisii H88]|uniref:SAGA-associated factor 11 n=1 Tax=Ajellomyces capsulatus (strain H88) TaxID=544711 RepID=F0UT58_AJEC8|nr:conserved hypothetical protein [Histoplasma capsulatum var. duboisii H88]